jgi:hypothetical protein
MLDSIVESSPFLVIVALLIVLVKLCNPNEELYECHEFLLRVLRGDGRSELGQVRALKTANMFVSQLHLESFYEQRLLFILAPYGETVLGFGYEGSGWLAVPI